MNIAIYSRKSKLSEKGESIDNQIQLCKEYAINHFGNDIEFMIYEDEGFSGGNTNRPMFQQLLDDATSKKFEVLICYRLDRISRNVLDFSSTLEMLQRYNISFISIKEQFDTTSPMGRAMIYVSSVFAQLERETIAERVRDNMLELAKAGRWLGGAAPLGYQSKSVDYVDNHMNNKKMSILKVDSSELELVQLIFNKYIELKSLTKVESYMLQHNYRTRRGSLFTKANIRIILKNPVYVKATKEVFNYLELQGITTYGEPDGIHGLLSYNKTKSILSEEGKESKMTREQNDWIAALSSHNGIIEATDWLYVQKVLEKNKENGFTPNLGKTHNALLTGIMRCPDCGGPMQITHGHISKKTGNKLYYYCCSLKKRSKGTLCKSSNVKADEIDTALINYLVQKSSEKIDFINSLNSTLIYQLNLNDTKEKEESLKKLLQKKKSQMDNLLNKVASLDDELTDLFIDKIKTLKNEIVSIETEITSIKNNQNKLIQDELSLDLAKIYLNKCHALDSLLPGEQHQIIHELIQKVCYDYNTGHVEVTFNEPLLNSKKKDLQH